MPIHEYACARCDHAFEFLSRGGSAPARCPRCGREALTRRFSVFGVARGGGEASPPDCDPARCSRGPGGCGRFPE